MIHSSGRHPLFQLFHVRQLLRTDGTELQRHPDALPLFHGAGGWHEAQLPAEYRRVLDSEVRLDRPQTAVGKADEYSAYFTVLGVDDVRAHLRGEDPRRGQAEVVLPDVVE